eukprot:TRINITY_DN10041_c0_g1_i1.p1 TRINITY_DN10041_c0_g1~~TRINITY_DN10041_c0_g1_i1.p1  ORF type:complete len:130 (-),score=15.88 TRINITY_DN10041_c0_g1_i1:219-608(-)
MYMDEKREEIILEGVTCGVYDYYVSIYTSGFSFDDAGAKVTVYYYDDDNHESSTEFRPLHSWKNETTDFWFATRVVIYENGETDIQSMEDLKVPEFPLDDCYFSVPCFGTVSTSIGVLIFALHVLIQCT